jgi:phosphoglycerate kinase
MAYEHLSSLLSSWPLEAKTILLRADLNVPLQEGQVQDDFRLQELLPTLAFIKQKGAVSIIITHIDRPRKPQEHLSTKHLIPWFREKGFITEFCPDAYPARCVTYNSHAEVIVMENSRFWPGEYNQDQAFAEQLALGMDYYINDAFGSEHRIDTSLTILPKLFPPERRSIGFLVERELRMLSSLKNPRHPFVVIVGGAKIPDKLFLLEGLLSIADTMLICPALSFTFAASRGEEIGKSLVDPSLYNKALFLLHTAATSSTVLMLPLDYIVAKDTFTGPLACYESNRFPHHGVGVACGPATITAWQPLIAQAQTIFFNGPMGDLTRPAASKTLQTLLEVITANTTAYKVIGGGDSLAAAHHFGLASLFDFCSTGGGATLAYLADKPLPGLDALIG